MKRQTIYCLLALAGLALSPLAYSSATPRPHSANVTQGGQQGQPARATDAEHPGVGLTKTGAGRLALNYVVKREDGETKVAVLVERGAVKKVTAADARGTRTLKSVKPGAGRAQPCDAAGQTRESLTLEEGQVIEVDACTSGLVALLVPAVQRIREAGGRAKSDGGGSSPARISGGASCTKDKPCCFEDEKLKMRVCWHP